MQDILHSIPQYMNSGEVAALFQVIMIDLMMAGDNAVVIGMAAARVPTAQRGKVIFWGLAAAVVLRIVLASIAAKLMAVIGLTLAGGILLLWVSWRFYRDLRQSKDEDEGAHVATGGEPALDTGKGSVRRAIGQIFIADISMSLDNVLGVAGAARAHPYILAGGLLLSIAMMGFAAGIIAKLLQRFHWLAYAGLIMIVYVALSMIWQGAMDMQRVM